jgi:hypothetical protein
MAKLSKTCPGCGKDAGTHRFCPFCGERVGEPPSGAAGVTREMAPIIVPPAGAPPLVSAPRPVPVQTGVPQAAVPGKRTALIAVLIVLAVAVVAGTVLAVVLLTGEKTTLAIRSPANGATIDGDPLRVELTVSGSGNISQIDVYLDGAKRATLETAPYVARIESVDNGVHELKVSALDAGGKKLAEATSSFESEGAGGTEGNDGTSDRSGEDGATAQYRSALTAAVNQASLCDSEITGAANRINSEANFNTGYVPAVLSSDVQALNVKVATLIASAKSLSPGAADADIQGRFLSLCELLRVRADALRKGLFAIEAGGDYKAQFDRGGAAKTSFDKEWPGFLSTCRSRGMKV